MDYDKKLNRLKELQSLAGNPVTDSRQRASLLRKLAFNAMDRKTLNKEIAKAQKDLGKARKEYDDSTSQLSSLERRVDNAKSNLENATSKLVDLNQVSRDLSLSGAEAVSEQGGEFAYVVDGKRMHVDTSDVNDIKMTPWREYQKSKKDSNNVDENDGNEEGLDEYNDYDSLENYTLSDMIDHEIDEEEFLKGIKDKYEDEEFDLIGQPINREDIFDPDFFESQASENKAITKIAKRKFR